MIEIPCKYKYFHVFRPPPQKILQNESKKNPKIEHSRPPKNPSSVYFLWYPHLKGVWGTKRVQNEVQNKCPKSTPKRYRKRGPKKFTQKVTPKITIRAPILDDPKSQFWCISIRYPHFVRCGDQNGSKMSVQKMCKVVKKFNPKTDRKLFPKNGNPTRKKTFSKSAHLRPTPIFLPPP